MNEDAHLDAYWEDRISGDSQGDYWDHGMDGGDPDYAAWNGEGIDDEEDE